jgi:hypothetical protein
MHPPLHRHQVFISIMWLCLSDLSIGGRFALGFIKDPPAVGVRPMPLTRRAVRGNIGVEEPR